MLDDLVCDYECPVQVPEIVEGCLPVGWFSLIVVQGWVGLPVPTHPIGGHELSKLLLHYNMEVNIEKSSHTEATK